MPITLSQFKALFNRESHVAVDMISRLSSATLEELLNTTSYSELDNIKNTLSDEEKADLLPFDYASIHDTIIWKNASIVFLRRHLPTETFIFVLSRLSTQTLNLFLVTKGRYPETENKMVTGLYMLLLSHADELHLYLTRNVDPLVIQKAISSSDRVAWIPARMPDEIFALYEAILLYVDHPRYSLTYKTEDFILFLNQQILRMDFRMMQGVNPVRVAEYESWMSYLNRFASTAEKYPEAKQSLATLRSLYQHAYINDLDEFDFKAFYTVAATNRPDMLCPEDAFRIGFHLFNHQQHFSAAYRTGLSLWKKFTTKDEDFKLQLSVLTYDFLRSAAARGEVDAKSLLLRYVAYRTDDKSVSDVLDGMQVQQKHDLVLTYPIYYNDFEKDVVMRLKSVSLHKPSPLFDFWNYYKSSASSGSRDLTFKSSALHSYLHSIDDLLTTPPLDIDEAWIDNLKKVMSEKITKIGEIPVGERKKILSVLNLLQDKIESMIFQNQNRLKK